MNLVSMQLRTGIERDVKHGFKRDFLGGGEGGDVLRCQ